MIAIRTNKEVKFMGGTGIVTLTIDFPIIRFSEKIYELRITDSCYKESTVDGVTTRKKVGKDIVRSKKYSYEQMQELINNLEMDVTKNTILGDIEEMFRLGLLAVTQKECIDGISGVEGQGMYYSEAQDWGIVRN